MSADHLMREHRLTTGRVVRIRTENVYPPIPDRSMDWSAVDDDRYDVDCDENGYFSLHPIGYGPSEELAIADLIEQLEEREED